MGESEILRIREASSWPRETVRIDPLGSRRETLIGIVTDVSAVDVAHRLSLKSGTVGARLVGPTVSKP